MANGYAKYSGLGGSGGGGGTVTDVTATTPLFSSGGVTPNLTIQVANTSQNGYLSSTDWNTFNNKQAPGSYANTALSNLASTSVNADIVPSGNGVINLGSSSHLYGNVVTFQVSSGSNQLSLTGSSITVNNSRIENVIDPVASQDAATKNYVDTHSGTGTVTSASIVSANGFAGTVATATTTPAITLSTTITGLLQGNGTALSAYVGGSLVESTSSVLTIGNGANAVIGTGTTLTVKQSSTSQSGYLSSTDWNTFNGKQAAGSYITALTGDGTAAGPGSVALTLATVNSNVGSFGSSSAIPSFTVNGKGLITAASTNVVVAPAGTLTGTTLASNVVSSSLTSLGTQASALNMGTHQINAVVDPTSAQDAATKNYVDTVASGLQPIQAVSAATTGSNIAGTYLNGVSGIGATFTTTSTSTFTVDGFTPTLNQRILFKDQTSGFQNGVYNITQLATGVLPAIFTRALDYDTAADIDAGNLIPVINGTINAQTSWLQTANVTTVGTDSLVFVKWTANPANYLLKANNLSDVSNAATSFNNISPMTTAGDIIYENATPGAARLPIGSTGNFLTVSSGIPAWTSVTPGAFNSEVAVNTGNGSGSVNTFVRRWTNSTDGVNGAVNTGSDITYADDALLGATFTINTTGTYAVTYGEAQSAGDQFGISKNQITGTQAFSQLSQAERVIGASTPGTNSGATTGTTLHLVSGDVIRGLWGNDGEGTQYFQYFRITRVN